MFARLAAYGFRIEAVWTRLSTARTVFDCIRPEKTAMRLKCALFTISCIALAGRGHAVDRAADQFSADTDFVSRAEQAGNQGIADARVALARCKNPEVGKVARLIQDDGTAVNQRLASLAVEKGWPTPALDPPDTMNHYSDHGYVVRQIKAEQSALAFYSEEAVNGTDMKLQEFARETVPKLRQRLVSLRLLHSS
jgi:putative membrane protein